jgi:trans-2,3-dihydro-3-hydroxyanthranilate isomerase
VTQTLKFRIVNVFAETLLGGNPLCVFEDGSGLDTETMQALALQFNLSETTFLLPAHDAAAVRRVRIFTPTFELPFAGHPTLGTAHVVRDLLGGGDRLNLQMQAGLVAVHANGDRWTLQAGQPTWHRPSCTRGELAHMLGIDQSEVLDGPLWVDTGSEQLVIALASPQAVARCRPNAELLARHAIGEKRRGLAYVWSRSADQEVCARFFLEKHGGVLEDPGTGSACANLGGWFIAHGIAGPLTARVSQGDHLGRPCRLDLHVDAARRIFVSGRVLALGRGEISLPESTSA